MMVGQEIVLCYVRLIKRMSTFTKKESLMILNSTNVKKLCHGILCLHAGVMTSLINKSTDWQPSNYHKMARTFPRSDAHPKAMNTLTPSEPPTSESRFSQTHNLGNNANIDIRGFTT